MPIRLMALDVDGTLTDEAGKISPENAAAVRRAMDAGVLVSLATGRPHQDRKSTRLNSRAWRPSAPASASTGR